MSNYMVVQNFIKRKQTEISMEYDDRSTYSLMQQQAYMVGVLENTLINVLDFIEIRYGKEVAHEAKQRALIIK